MNDLSHLAGKLLGGRYQLDRPLGRGAFGHTLLARDVTSGKEVAVKLLDPRGAPDWKAFDLFEREAAVLRSLRHPAIPEVFELLREQEGEGSALFLVMEYVQGVSLGRMIEQGVTFDAEEAQHLFLEMLGVLEYLHGRAPPVLHRDIKPANIIVRPDGRPALVDFGSVRSVLAPDDGGSTIVGTYGYMPFEQFMGQANPSSDLYALGATFLHLLTGRPPRDFVNQEGRIVVPAALPGDARLARVIARLLLPSLPDRFQSAVAVRAALVNPTVAAARAPTMLRARSREAAADVALELPASRAHTRPAPFLWHYMAAEGGRLPLLFAGILHRRRHRLRAFMCEGIAGTAQIVAMRQGDLGFGVTIAHVSYEFEADGALRRDVDQVLPGQANRWRVGDALQILYLPERDYDSVIVSAS
jgi:serine/threonine protein kinase